MVRPNRQAHAASAGSIGHSAARHLEAAALLVLLAVLAFRPLLSEVYEHVPLQPWLAELAPHGPGPATTILTGAAIQLAILCWLLSRLIDGRLPAPLAAAIDKLDVELAGTIPSDAVMAEFEFSGRPLIELPADTQVVQSVFQIAARILDGHDS